jgi:hypothetical protein
MRLRPLLALLTLSALVLPGTALAAPDRTATLSAASASFAWAPPAATGQYLTLSPVLTFDPAACSKEEDTYCDQTLVNFQAAPGSTAKLQVDIDGYDIPNDFDLFLYKSDASGMLGEEVTPSGDSSVGNPSGDPETLIVDELEPGYYLVVVQYFYVDNATFNGVAKVTGAVPGGSAPPAGGGTTPSGGSTTPPASQPSSLPFKAAASIGSAKRARKSRSFSFKVTADAAISNLKVRLVIPKGPTIGTATVASLPQGTRTLKLKLSSRYARKLKRGRYQLVATGVVDGRTLSVSQSVTVKG